MSRCVSLSLFLSRSFTLSLSVSLSLSLPPLSLLSLPHTHTLSLSLSVSLTHSASKPKPKFDEVLKLYTLRCTTCSTSQGYRDYYWVCGKYTPALAFVCSAFAFGTSRLFSMPKVGSPVNPDATPDATSTGFSAAPSWQNSGSGLENTIAYIFLAILTLIVNWCHI